MTERKCIIVDTIGQLPIFGGVTGPILRPFYLDIPSIRTMLAFRISVKEVQTDEEGNPVVRKGRYVTMPLDFENYDKTIEFPESKKKFFYNEQRNQNREQPKNTMNIRPVDDRPSLENEVNTSNNKKADNTKKDKTEQKK